MIERSQTERSRARLEIQRRRCKLQRSRTASARAVRAIEPASCIPEPPLLNVLLKDRMYDIGIVNRGGRPQLGDSRYSAGDRMPKFLPRYLLRSMPLPYALPPQPP